MQASSALGISHFLSQTDAVGIVLFAILVLMSVISWSLIFARVRRSLAQRQLSQRFCEAFSVTRAMDSLRQLAAEHAPACPRARLAKTALEAADHGVIERAPALIALESPAELVVRSLQQSIDDEAARMEHGQTSLASIASSAPFIGLFGTVWGIYHALISIGATGQSSLDQVAGPVGEALIMTALGLAVAIPAALAYNAFQRQTRMHTASLERFAHEMLLRLSVGTAVGTAAGTAVSAAERR